jgi:hypothetical protein
MVAPAYVDYGTWWMGLNEQAFDYVVAHTGYMECPNCIASCVAELDDTLPRFTDVQ